EKGGCGAVTGKRARAANENGIGGGRHRRGGSPSLRPSRDWGPARFRVARGARNRAPALSPLRSRTTFHDRPGHKTEMGGRSGSERNFCDGQKQSGRSSAALLLRRE